MASTRAFYSPALAILIITYSHFIVPLSLPFAVGHLHIP